LIPYGSKGSSSFLKKEPKNFIRLATPEWWRVRTLQWIKSLFASFCSQKEDSSFLA
jgi:hypothetical protein